MIVEIWGTDVMRKKNENVPVPKNYCQESKMAHLLIKHGKIIRKISHLYKFVRQEK